MTRIPRILDYLIEICIIVGCNGCDDALMIMCLRQSVENVPR